MREGRSCLPCSGQGSHLRGGLSPVPAASSLPAVPGGDTGAATAPPGKEGSEGHREGSPTAHGWLSLQQALIAKGQLKASGGR